MSFGIFGLYFSVHGREVCGVGWFFRFGDAEIEANPFVSEFVTVWPVCSGKHIGVNSKIKFINLGHIT